MYCVPKYRRPNSLNHVQSKFHVILFLVVSTVHSWEFSSGDHLSISVGTAIKSYVDFRWAQSFVASFFLSLRFVHSKKIKHVKWIRDEMKRSYVSVTTQWFLMKIINRNTKQAKTNAFFLHSFRHFLVALLRLSFAIMVLIGIPSQRWLHVLNVANVV